MRRERQKDVSGNCKRNAAKNDVSGKLVKGGLLVADNAINHYESIKGMIQKSERRTKLIG
jgi:hypothetical protein